MNITGGIWCCGVGVRSPCDAGNAVFGWVGGLLVLLVPNSQIYSAPISRFYSAPGSSSLNLLCYSLLLSLFPTWANNHAPHGPTVPSATNNSSTQSCAHFVTARTLPLLLSPTECLAAGIPGIVPLRQGLFPPDPGSSPQGRQLVSSMSNQIISNLKQSQTVLTIKRTTYAFTLQSLNSPSRK